MYAFAALSLYTTTTPRMIIINNRSINEYCKPGEPFVYHNNATSNMHIQIYDGVMKITPHAVDHEHIINNLYTEIKHHKAIRSNNVTTHSTEDIYARKVYMKNESSITLNSDEIIEIATSIMEAPIVECKAYRVKFSDSFIDTTMLRLQPSNPDSVVNEMIFIFDTKHPAFVQGHIDFQSDEPTGELILSGVCEVQISFKSEAFIDTPGRELGLNYGTHMACLMAVATSTTGPILEMGSGDYSTPLLHAVCAKDKRYLLSTDTDKNWLNLFADLETDWHELKHVEVYADDWSRNPQPDVWDTVGGDTHWSVVFIDHRPGERRAVDIQRLRDNTDIFVVHDTEHSGYGFGPILSSFKYIHVDKRYSTHTTVASNRVNVRKLFSK
jgi:hypothetical protein